MRPSSLPHPNYQPTLPTPSTPTHSSIPPPLAPTVPSQNKQNNQKQQKTNKNSSGRYAHLLKPDVPRFHTARTDLDNLVKLVLDSLNEYAYEDDRQARRHGFFVVWFVGWGGGGGVTVW